MDFFDYTVRVRRQLHTFPELSDNEVKTGDFIARELKGMGHKVTRVHTGCVVNVVGESRRTVALRADIDGLPITERTDCGFCSQNGNMHACGHDGHTAMLLTVAKMLAERKPKVSVRLLFQFGEEGSGGAEKMIEAGCLKGVDRIFALHMCPDLEKGRIASCAGAMFAGTVEFDVDFAGLQSHCADREKGADACLALGRFMNAVRDVEKAHGGNVLLHIGKVSAGSARNIVADAAHAECTLRFFDEERREAAMMSLSAALVAGDNACGTQHTVTVHAVYPPLINGGLALAELRKLCDLQECEPRFTAEDFAFYLQHTEGCMAWLGCKDDKYSSPLHSATFGFDEKALVAGLEVYEKLIF